MTYRSSRVIVCACWLTVPPFASAQTPAGEVPPPSPTWTYGGFVDAAYPNALNDPLNKIFRSRGTVWHVDDLYLNMAGAYAKKAPTDRSRWGGELLLHAGKDAEIFGFSATAPNMHGSDWLRHVGLANLSYLTPAGNGLTLQAGVFPSLIGYDSLYAKDNNNYTRPWGADFTPYLMLGVNAVYPFTEKLTATFYVVNGYWHLADANGVPSSGVQLAYRIAPEITVKQTVLAGPHQPNTNLEFWRLLSDTIVERRTRRLVVAANVHFATERVDDAEPVHAWWVAAQLPVRLALNGLWSLSLRPEWAWDSKGRWTLASQDVRALTTTAECRLPYKWSAVILRFEHRVDTSHGPQGGFFGDVESAPGTIALQRTQHLLVVAALLTFDSPKPK